MRLQFSGSGKLAPEFEEGGATGVDDGFAVRSFDNLGAWILGRNMFGPVRGASADAKA